MSEYKAIAESNTFIVLDKYTKEWQVHLVPTLPRGNAYGAN